MYKTNLRVTTEDFIVQNRGEIEDTAEAELGDLTGSFDIGIFHDPLFQTPIESYGLYAGNTVSDSSTESYYLNIKVYISVNWKLKVLGASAKFFVNKCEIDVGIAHKIAIIDNSCYSGTFGTKKISALKLQSSNFQFSFTSFIVDATKADLKMSMGCDVKVCVTNEDKCAALIASSNEQCPNVPEYRYNFER